ncbi:leucyl aminopeptidase [Lysinibacter cavernae]|uniref:Probable cytosol aminopeptidase n=1 Tax=Lysinibacter cavernae TaxID=1640652 RepID=A0A7X5R1W9_9MICO|nr:leucyl aminopeptidase [Lysinibacter cavernae]NIH54079.1 leucyl aminopeptidase [Lysinibacter cavernae]
MTVVIDPSFDPAPSLSQTVDVTVATGIPATADAVAIAVASEGPVAEAVGFNRESLIAAGFTGSVGSTLNLPQPTGAAKVIVGIGAPDSLTPATLRDATAAFARAAGKHGHLSFDLRGLSGSGIDPAVAGQVVTEGAVLARYRYNALKSEPESAPLESLTIVVDEATNDAAVREGVARGLILSRAGSLARDLANTPPRHLNAVKMGEIATAIGAQTGLEVEVFDRQQLIDLGCGGLLGVNAGSTEEPRMVKLTYRPENGKGHLALVGKGIMYDSGGISLKPSNAMHLAMKMDMSGAAAVLASMSVLKELGASVTVTGYLMCTDNMPSGSATKLGDVLTIRGGTTVEVKNTDAEGRLVMADALVLASETKPDAIIDIATLTGACLVALGPDMAGLLGNNQGFVDQVKAAAETTDETAWQLPLDHRYRDQLKSDVADISNLGGEYAGATTAALFLNEFVDGIPWAHLDIAGTMKVDKDASWRSIGATGFGARLLAELAVGFERP